VSPPLETTKPRETTNRSVAGKLDGRSLFWQIVRKGMQFSVLIFVLWAAINTHWRNFKVAHNNARLVGLLTDPITAKLYDWNDRFFIMLGEWTGMNALQASEQFGGEPWALTIFGVRFTDPYAALSVLVQGEMLPLATLLGALLPLALALVLGKVFCSFLCPARLMFEVTGAMRLGLIRLGFPLPTLQLPRLGLWVGLALVLFAAGSGAATAHFILPYVAATSGMIGLIVGGSLTASGTAFLGMLAADLLVAPGQVCRSLCPTGALLEVVGRKSLLRLEKKQEACPTGCNLCQRACPYGLFPGAETHLPGCDTCGRCTAYCPTQKLSPTLGFRRPPAPPTERDPAEESAA
jgi:ferredoxin-type protein NapH